MTGRMKLGDGERDGTGAWAASGDCGGRSSRMGPLCAAFGVRWMRFVKKPESLFDERT